jgi:hypothetical protein
VAIFLVLGDKPLASSASTRVAGGGKSGASYIGTLANVTATGNSAHHSSLSLRVTTFSWKMETYCTKGMMNLSL